MKTLPEELILEILLRLPVKSLLRFKCVCKQWQSLISNTHFAKLHFERASTSPDSHRILYVVANQFLSIDIDSSLHDDSAVVNLDCPLITSPASVQIMGSCRGFLLLVPDDDEKLFIWNPSTNACKTIPPSPMRLSGALSIFYGFASGSSSDDFLVVQVSDDVKARDTLAHVEIFSPRTNSWKKLDFDGLTLPYKSYKDQVPESDPAAGSCLSNAIHWVALHVDGPFFSHAVIIALDLAPKNLREFPMPDDFEDGYCDLAVLGGCLSLIDMNSADKIEIWVMKQYGVKASWTRSVVVPLDAINGDDYLSPICLTKSGEVIAIDCGAKLVKCNDKGELVELREFYHQPCGACATAYTESILSLPGQC